MAFCYTSIILPDTERAIYDRGLRYADEGKVDITVSRNNGCTATVAGTQSYEVFIGFKRTGAPKYTCTCPYFASHRYVCKHIIAASLAYDRSRGVEDPGEEHLVEKCIPEPTFTHKDINDAFEDPLNANLDIIRIAVDERGWVRPHAHLPSKPKSCESSITCYMDVKKGLSEIRAWSRKYNFDPYFCAGEMMAGYCDLIRSIKSDFEAMKIDDWMMILELLVDFHLELVLELIDCSDGIYIFSEAHILDIFNEVAKNSKGVVSEEDMQKLTAKLLDY